MILRQHIFRLPVRECTGVFRKNTCKSVRCASVSSQIHQSQPERPSGTDYLEKYQEKLKRKAREEGVSSISELRERYQPKIINLKKNMAAPPPKFMNSRPATPSPTAARPTPPAATPIKTLSSYVDIDKLRQHTDPKEIELIWRAGHAKDSLICAAIPIAMYNRMTSVARDHPMFVLPLPRKQGIEMHFMQFKFPETNVTHILFTSLLEYKTHGEFARPHTTIMHFEDLSEEKGIVLMRGEVDTVQKAITLDDASMLVMGVQKLYGADGATERGRVRRTLIEQFTRGSEEFDHNKLMDELNRID